MTREIYLDNNATTHMSVAVQDVLAEVLAGKYGNASSEHRSGERTRRAITHARDSLASLLNTSSDEIYFGSGVTELTYWVLSEVLGRAENAHLVTTEVEHSCVLETASFLETKGVTVTRLAVDQDGLIQIPSLRAAIQGNTALVSIQWVNNETGVIQPIDEIAQICAKAGVPFHCDAAQALGKLNIDLSRVAISYLTVSAHKIHGPAGIGALYVSNAAQLRQLLHGGTQEQGRRPGTENTLGIIGFGRAASERAQSLASTIDYIAGLRDRFESIVLSALPQVEINGRIDKRVCSSTNMMFPGIDGAAVVALLDREGIRCSQSSACTSNRPEPSYVLRAMGLSEEDAFASVRFSFSNQNTMSEVEYAASRLIGIFSRLSGIEAKTENSKGVVKHEV